MAGPAAKPRGGEKLRKEESKKRGGEGEEEGKALLPERTSKWKCLGCFLIIHANSKSRSKMKPRRTGPLSHSLFFNFSLFFFLDGSSVTTNALPRHDMNIQLT